VGADEEGTLAQLKAHRYALFDPKITEHRGRIVKTTGDGMLVEFASVVDAVRCAVEIQRGMVGRNADVSEEKRIQFRIGINLGDIIIDGGDIFGDGVNVAARLEGVAEPGHICISDWQPKLFPVAIVPRPRQPLPPALDGIQECAAGSAHPGAGTRRGTPQPAAGARPEASSAAELNAPESCLKAQNSRPPAPTRRAPRRIAKRRILTGPPAETRAAFSHPDRIDNTQPSGKVFVRV